MGDFNAECTEFTEARGRGRKRGWRSSVGESEGMFSEPNMKYYSIDSYHLSIEMLFTEEVIRTGRGRFKWEWRKSRGLRELGGE